MNTVANAQSDLQLPILKTQNWSAKVLRLHVMQKERLVGLWLDQCAHWDAPKVFVGQVLALGCTKNGYKSVRVEGVSYVRKSVFQNAQVQAMVQKEPAQWSDCPDGGDDRWIVSVMFKAEDVSRLEQYEALKKTLHEKDGTLWCQKV